MSSLSDRLPIRIAACYVAIAVAWILVSDHVLGLLAPDPDWVRRLQTYKGVAFVLFTAVLLFLVLRQYLRNWDRENAQRRQAELALRESESRLQNVAANLPGAIFRYVLRGDNSDAIEYMSPGCRELWEVEPQAAEQDPHILWQMVHPDDLDDVRRRVLDAARTQTEWSHVWRVVTPSGKLKWLQANARFSRHDSHSVHWDALILDVTERVRAEQELRRLNEELESRVQQRTAELEAKNQELEMFTYSVSHDLKAPLRGISGYSQLLVTDHAEHVPGEAREMLEHIRGLTMQMNQLIEDLLTYSRLDLQPKSSESLNLNSLIRPLLDQVDQQIRSRGGDCIVNIPEGTLQADPEGLTMALRNLLDNAVKFSQGRDIPRIEVGADREENTWRVWVRDNGVGFDMQYHDRIFQIFQRLQRAEDYPGTGVGLAIVDRAMQRMGGRAWADSKVGEGTTVYLEIPQPTNGSGRLSDDSSIHDG